MQAEPSFGGFASNLRSFNTKAATDLDSFCELLCDFDRCPDLSGSTGEAGHDVLISVSAITSLSEISKTVDTVITS